MRFVAAVSIPDPLVTVAINAPPTSERSVVKTV